MHDLVRRSYRAIVTGMVDDVMDYIHDDFVNDEATSEPPAAEAGGPWGFATTVAWLRTAYSELDVIEHEFMQDADRNVSEVTMHGTHTGALVVRDGHKHVVFPPSGRRFAHRHVQLRARSRRQARRTSCHPRRSRLDEPTRVCPAHSPSPRPPTLVGRQWQAKGRGRGV